jgi:hypothetical protein
LFGLEECAGRIGIPEQYLFIDNNLNNIIQHILFSRSLDSCHRSYVRRSLSKIINLLHARNNTASGKDKKTTADGQSYEGMKVEGGRLQRSLEDAPKALQFSV